MSDRRETTMHGHSIRCALCTLPVYSIWVSEEPPPTGCSNGLDAAPWTCGHVLNSILMGVVRIGDPKQTLQRCQEARPQPGRLSTACP